MYKVLMILASMVPVILAGIFNMVFVKLKVFNAIKVPIDNGMKLKDGKRLFGDNKTWKGFIGMIVFGAVSMLIVGILSMKFEGFKNLLIYDFANYNSPFDYLLFGGAVGFGYALFELPNSFIKRRIDIKPGTNAAGIIGKIFVLVDQGDSIIGCLLFMSIFHMPTFEEAVLFVLIGVGVHYLTNVMLYFMKLKSQAA